MKTSRAFLLFASFMLYSALAAQGLEHPYHSTQTPAIPVTNGTYFYEGYDIPNDRYVYISVSGTYHYVDSGGNVTTGGTTAAVTNSPYRVVVVGGTSTFQFNNNHNKLYTFTSTTGINGEIVPAIDFSPRSGMSGTWFASDVTFTHSYNTGADTAALYVAGASGTYRFINNIIDPNNTALTEYSGTYLYVSNTQFGNDDLRRVLYDHSPVTFSGTNINISVNVPNNTAQQAISISNNAAVYLYGGTISKTVTAAGAGSEVIYMIGNQEGNGSTAHFHGEDLTIVSIVNSGTDLEAFNMANGKTTVELYRTTITATTGTGAWGGPNTTVIKLNDQERQGGAHFYGEEITINNYQGRTFAFGYGENSITLKNSTITASGTWGAVFRWITSEGTGGGAGGNEAMADNLTNRVFLEDTNVITSADYSPIFQQTGRLGWATVIGGTLTTTGNNSPIIRLVGANDAQDESKFNGIFTNVLLEARNSSAIDLDIYTRDRNYGEDGGGISKEVTTLITTAWDLVFISSTINGTSAIRLATAGAYNSPLSNETVITARNSAINGRIEMIADGGSSGSFETSGANLTLYGRNSTFTGGFFITGSANARKPHQAWLELTDSTWTGDFIGTNRGNVLLKFVNTQVTGNLAFSGSTITYLDLIDTPIDGGVFLDGTTTFINNPGTDLNNRRATIHNSPITGGFNLAGASYLDLTFDGSETVVSGGITAADVATGIFRLENNSSINGGVTVSGSSSVIIILSYVNQLTGDLYINHRARLALATFAGTPIHLNRSLTLQGIWGITGKTTLAGLFQITDPLGTIAIENAGPDILTLSSGLIGNGRLDIVSIDGNALGDDKIRVIHDPTGDFAPDALILSHPVDYGLIAYDIDNRPDGAYLIRSTGFSGAGAAAVVNSQALMVEDWLAALIPINNRLSELRQSNVAIFSGDTTGGPARGDAGAFWLQARADTTKVDTGSDFRDFDSRTIGFTAGVEARWDSDISSFSSGIFIDTARTARDFIETAEGSTNSVGGGVYIHYHHRKGFFTSAIARFDTYETTLDTNSPNNVLNADYNTQALGVAIDIGWRFELANSGWWYEPAFQLAIASFPGVSYTTQGNDIGISTEDGRATQNILRFGFGKALGQKWSFHGYLAMAKVSANGGEFSTPDIPPAQFTIDGDRIEASIGMRRQIGRAGRLSLNVTYVDSDKYQRPCIFSGGYSHAW